VKYLDSGFGLKLELSVFGFVCPGMDMGVESDGLLVSLAGAPCWDGIDPNATVGWLSVLAGKGTDSN
jgi:hypothetical protein